MRGADGAVKERARRIRGTRAPAAVCPVESIGPVKSGTCFADSPGMADTLPSEAEGRRSHRPLSIALVIGAVALAVRLPFLSWPLISDEGGYAYTASWWLRGLTLYSESLWFDRPQGIFVAYLPPVLLGGETWLIRAWGSVWAAATAVVTFFVARRLFDDRVATAAGLLCAVFSAMPLIEGFTANAEVFALLPATMSVHALLARRPAWAGVLASLAFLLKPSGGSIALLAGAWLLSTRDPAGLVRYVAAGLVLPAIALLHGILTVGAESYLYAVAGFRAGLVEGVALERAQASALKTAGAWLPLALLACLARPPAFVLLWLAASLAGMAMGGHWRWHYWIQLMPALATAAAPGLVSLAGFRRVYAVPVLGVPLVLFAQVALLPPLEGSWRLYERRGYQIAADVASYVRARTGPEESIYVAFAEADIYHLAGRRAAVPHLYWLEVTSLPGVYDRVVAAIEEREPVYVLALDPVSTRVDPERRFLRALERGDRLEAVFEGVGLCRRVEDEGPRVSSRAVPQ